MGVVSLTGLGYAGCLFGSSALNPPRFQNKLARVGRSHVEATTVSSTLERQQFLTHFHNLGQLP
jgi:hypothetical protein